MKIIGGVLVTIAVSVASAASFCVWWRWFIAGPDGAFQGLPYLSLVQALGLGLIVRWLTIDIGIAHDDDQWQTIVKSLAVLVLFWALAIAYHAFQ